MARVIIDPQVPYDINEIVEELKLRYRSMRHWCFTYREKLIAYFIKESMNSLSESMKDTPTPWTVIFCMHSDKEGNHFDAQVMLADGKRGPSRRDNLEFYIVNFD